MYHLTLETLKVGSSPEQEDEFRISLSIVYSSQMVWSQ